jgi:hypothetical protein
VASCARYAPLDSVELYSPDGSGRYSARRAGDTMPFREREIEYRTFVFPILERPGVTTYYLRFRTEGSMDIHLRAWTPMEFIGQINREMPVLWVFYSFIFIMACYNLYLFFSIKKPSYLYFSLFIASYLILQMVLDGSSFQFLCRISPGGRITAWPWRYSVVSCSRSCTPYAFSKRTAQFRGCIGS